jgi:hypothetical protein
MAMTPPPGGSGVGERVESLGRLFGSWLVGSLPLKNTDLGMAGLLFA